MKPSLAVFWVLGMGRGGHSPMTSVDHPCTLNSSKAPPVGYRSLQSPLPLAGMFLIPTSHVYSSIILGPAQKILNPGQCRELRWECVAAIFPRICKLYWPWLLDGAQYWQNLVSPHIMILHWTICLVLLVKSTCHVPLSQVNTYVSATEMSRVRPDFRIFHCSFEKIHHQINWFSEILRFQCLQAAHTSQLQISVSQYCTMPQSHMM
jgi:hypothetical protein